MLFTHFGLSGPIALRCSQFVVKALKQFQTKNIEVAIVLLPDKSTGLIAEEILQLAALEPKKSVKNVCKGYLPEKLLPLLLQAAGMADSLTCESMPKEGWVKLAQLIKRFPIRVYGTLSLEDAFVTGGGIHLKEVDPRTMQSKLMPGLFFCGEILDIHGYTGGYNITAAFSTGYLAGANAVLPPL